MHFRIFTHEKRHMCVYTAQDDTAATVYFNKQSQMK